jgi:hypothetical protein
MRALLLALTVVALTTGAAFAQTPGNTAPPPAAAGYTDEWCRNFIEGCMDGANGLPRPICQCGIDTIEREVPFADSRALDEAAAAGRSPDPRTLDAYRSILQRCLSNTDA